MIKNNIFKILLFTVFMFNGLIYSQTVFSIAEGVDVLKPTIDAAVAGDIIELTTSGGVYLSSEQIILDKNITIKSRTGLSIKPILKYVGEETGAYMFKIVATPKIVFEGIEFDGDGTADGAAALAKYILRIDSGDSTSTIGIRLNDCVLHDVQDKIIKPYPYCGIDSLIIHNTTFYNSGKEGVVLNSGASGDPQVYMDYAEFVNCTFYSLTREAIKADTNPNTQLLVDHCTFYDIGGADKAFIYVDDALKVAIKNSIFQKNLETGNFIRLEGETNTINNCVVWDVNDWVVLS